MTGFFSKLFGGKKKSADFLTVQDAGSKKASSSVVELVEQIMNGLIAKAHLDLEFTVRAAGPSGEEEVTVELMGVDQELLTEKEGALLDAFQLFIKRVIQHQMPASRANVSFDTNGFREENNKSLVELAERLRDKALEQGRSVYLRALPPKDRKVVHQFLASDDRVRSRSVGDGLYKKIKIYPVKNTNRAAGSLPEDGPAL